MEFSMAPFLVNMFPMIGFRDCSILSWNIRSAASDVAKRHIKEYLKHYKPSIVILLETHTQFSQVSKFWEILGYSVVHIVEARVMQGGFGFYLT